MRRGLPVVVSLLAAAIAVRAAGQNPPAFRAGVEVVDVDVSVLDKFRQPVTGLTAADFTVLEDGKPRPIVAFTPVDLPPRELPPARWLAEVAPDAQTNDLQREGRLVVVLMDRSVAFADVPYAKKIAEAAIDQLRPADLAAVVYAEYGIPQNFTTDRRRLLAAIRQPAVGLPEGDAGDSGPCFCGTCTLESIQQIADGVRDVRQRRKILFVIGSNVAVTGRGSCSAAISYSRTRALRAIQAANLTVYVLDPSGVRTLSANASVSAPPARNAMANLQRLGNLQILPDETGGRAVFGNDPARALPELFRESNSYYVLGINPGHADARFHDITVKVGKRDLIVQARHGYYAAGARPAVSSSAPKGVSAALHSGIAGLWPVADLPLTVTAAPVATPGMKSGAVVLTLGIDRPARGVAGAVAPFNGLIGAFDRNGRELAYQQGRVDARRRGGPADGYDLVSRLELKPGRYEVRAAVEDASTGEIGSVYTYVDVPNYFTEFVSLSGIFFYTTRPTPLGAIAGNAPAILPFVPTPRREFQKDDRASAWFEIYEGISRQAMPGYVLIEIRDEHDARVFHQETRTLASDLGANRAMQMNVDLPFDHLAPGEYLLHVQVRQGNKTAERDARFRVR